MLTGTESKLDVRILTRPDGTRVLTLFGEAAGPGVSDLESAVSQINIERPDRLIVDLRGLGFTSSLAVGQLMSLLSTARSGYGRVVVVCEPTDHVYGVLERSRMNLLAPIVGTLDDADGLVA